MLFKYFIEFDNGGEIKNFYKSKKDCKDCKEYLVKLIPIDRKQENLNRKSDEIDKLADKILKGNKRLETEFNKMIKDLRRIKI